MFCPRCGRENRKGAKFCDNCGFPLGNIILQEQESDEYAEKANKVEKIVNVSGETIASDEQSELEDFANEFKKELNNAYKQRENDYLMNYLHDSLVDKDDNEVFTVAKSAPYNAKGYIHATEVIHQILQNGTSGELSDAQLTMYCINLNDVRRNLSSLSERRDVNMLYQYYMAQTASYTYNQIQLVEKIGNIYAHFDKLAPVDKYTGNYSLDMASFIREVRATWGDIDLLPHKGFSARRQLKHKFHF